MHRRFAHVPAIVLAVVLLVVPAARGSVQNAPTAAQPPTTMTYQGLLRVNGVRANGMDVAGTVTKVAASTSANSASTLALRDASGSLSLQTLNLDGTLTLPNTNGTGTVGLLTLGGNRFLHNAGTSNTFVGALAGS